MKNYEMRRNEMKRNEMTVSRWGSIMSSEAFGGMFAYLLLCKVVRIGGAFDGFLSYDA